MTGRGITPLLERKGFPKTKPRAALPTWDADSRTKEPPQSPEPGTAAIVQRPSAQLYNTSPLFL